MMSFLIRLRKHTILPLMWWLRRKDLESLIKFPSASELLTRADETRAKFLAAQRIKDDKETAYQAGAQSVIDWIVNYGDS